MLTFCVARLSHRFAARYCLFADGSLRSGSSLALNCPAFRRIISVVSQCCGLRLILKSYELDVVATSMEEARAWVRGVNHLPLGGKHRILIELMRQNAISGGDDEDD